MALSRLERETVINFNDAESEASIYSSSRTLIRRLTKRLGREPDRFGASWAEWLVPKRWITLPRAKAKRTGVPSNLQRGRQFAKKAAP